MSVKQIDNHHEDYAIDKNGSVTLGSKDNSFAATITQGPANSPTAMETIKEQGRVLTCSFEE